LLGYTLLQHGVHLLKLPEDTGIALVPLHQGTEPGLDGGEIFPQGIGDSAEDVDQEGQGSPEGKMSWGGPDGRGKGIREERDAKDP